MYKYYSITLLFLVGFFSVQAYEWVNPQTDKDIRTIFIQGIVSTQIQCAKYCGQKGFQALTGEQVMSPIAGDLIYNPYIGAELEEVLLKNESPRKWYQRMWFRPVQEFFVSCKHQKYKYQVIGTKEGAPTVATHAIDFSKLNIGQEPDMAVHAKKVTQCNVDHPDADLVLFGSSRGAATTFNACAKYKYDNVKLVVLEGCFDNVPHIIDKRFPTLSKFKLSLFAHYLFPLATAYRRDGMTPDKCVDNFPEGVPIAFISSKADKKVPYECTERLIEKLVDRGKNPIYYLLLEDAKHVAYPLGDGKDQEKYHQFLHAIYKKYNLPHIPEYAKQGKELARRITGYSYETK